MRTKWFLIREIRSVAAYLTQHGLKAPVACGYITQLVKKAWQVAEVPTQTETWRAAEGLGDNHK